MLTEVYYMAKLQYQELSEAMFYLLIALKSKCHGYGIMQKVSEISNNRVKLGAGTLYALLSRFELDEFIKIVDDDGRRKVYIITEKGKTVLDNEISRLKTLISDAEKGDLF